MCYIDFENLTTELYNSKGRYNHKNKAHYKERMGFEIEQKPRNKHPKSTFHTVLFNKVSFVVAALHDGWQHGQHMVVSPRLPHRFGLYVYGELDSKYNHSLYPHLYCQVMVNLFKFSIFLLLFIRLKS